MDYLQLDEQLKSEGLRLAETSEPGWVYAYIDSEGNRSTVWVTDEI